MVSGIALMLACWAPAQEEGTLKGFEKPFKESRRSSRSRSHRAQEDQSPPRHARPSSELDWDDDDDDDGWCAELFGSIAWAVISYPFTDHRLRFEDYPYAADADGYFTDEWTSTKAVSFEARAYALRAEHDLWAWGAAADFRLNTNLGLRADVSQYRETVGDRADSLELHEYEFNVSLGDGGRRVNVSLGMGVGILSGADTHAGVSFQTAVEWYPVEPVSFRVHASTILFPHAELYDLSAEVRLHWNRAAFFVGVRSIINSDGDDITGPMIGFSIWF